MSFVLGLASFFCAFVTGAIAVVLGVLALGNISKSRGQLQGSGFAIAGIVLGAIGCLWTFVLVAMLLPAVQVARERALEVQRAHETRLAEKAASPKVSRVPPSQVNPPPRSTSRPPVAESMTIEIAMEYLPGSDERRIHQALDYLAGHKPDSKYQPKLPNQLTDLLKHSSHFVRAKSLGILQHWAVKENSAGIAQALSSRTVDQKECLELLGRLKDPDVIPQVIPFLKEGSAVGDAAEQVLRSFGAAATEHLLEVANSDGRLQERARRLLKESGTQQDVLTRQTVQDLSRVDKRSREKIFQSLAETPLLEEVQPEVSAALAKSLTPDDLFYNNKILAALQVWGDQESAVAVAKALTKRKIDPTLALNYLAQQKTPETIEAILPCLNSAFGEGEAAVAAMTAFGDQAIPAVVTMFHSSKTRERTNARALLADLEVPEETLIAQCIVDLGSSEDSRQDRVVKWLTENSIEIEDAEQQNALLVGLKRIATGDHHFRRAAAGALVVKLTPADQAGDLFALLEDKENKIANAAMLRLIELEYKSASDAIALRLSKFLPRRSVIAALSTMPEAEALVIPILAHNDPKIVIACCDVLKSIGTRKSLRALNATLSRANRAKRKDVSTAAQTAMQAVKSRQ